MAVPEANRNFVCLDVLVEALGTAKSRYVGCPVRGTVRRIISAVDVAVDGDNVCTPKINGTEITGGAQTLTTAQTAGLGLVSLPSAANSVKCGDILEIATDGGGTAGQARFTFLIETH